MSIFDFAFADTVPDMGNIMDDPSFSEGIFDEATGIPIETSFDDMPIFGNEGLSNFAQPASFNSSPASSAVSNAVANVPAQRGNTSSSLGNIKAGLLQNMRPTPPGGPATWGTAPGTSMPTAVGRLGIQDPQNSPLNVIDPAKKFSSGTRKQSPSEIIFHHTGGPNTRGAMSALQNRGLSYNYIINKQGDVNKLVDPSRRAFHAKGNNTGTLGISFVGGKRYGSVNDAQHNAAIKLTNQLKQQYPSIKSITGHQFRDSHPGRKAGEPTGFNYGLIANQTGLKFKDIATTPAPKTLTNNSIAAKTQGLVGPTAQILGEVGKQGLVGNNPLLGIRTPPKGQTLLDTGVQMTGNKLQAMNIPKGRQGVVNNINSTVQNSNSIMPKEYYHKMAMIESRLNPNAKSPTGAQGLFQFTSRTWKGYGKGNRFDPVANTQAAIKFTNANHKYLKRKLGRDPQPHELYMAHNIGPGGARRLLSANPSARVSRSLIGSNPAHNPKFFRGKNGFVTVQEAIKRYKSSFYKN